MNQTSLTRRRFIQGSAAITGAAVLARPSWGSGAKRKAADQVQLGRTGVMLSRLGIGTGSANGQEQMDMGREGLAKLIQYAYEHGITYIDTAERYRTFEWIGDCIKGLPREKLFIQSKVPGIPEDVLKQIDYHRTVLKTDYIDSLLVHCMIDPGWTDKWARVMDGFNEAKEKKWIRVKGVSCHTLPALQAAVKSDWCETHLVRVNPQGRFMDGRIEPRGMRPQHVEIDPVLKEIQTMHEKGRGVIGMKIIGNGTFRDVADREKSVHFAMNNPNIDAVVIGMTSTAQVDENIAMINRALAES